MEQSVATKNKITGIILATLKSFGFIALYFIVNLIIIVGAFLITGVEDIDGFSPNLIVATLFATQVIVLIILFLIYRKRPFREYMRFIPVTRLTLFWSFIVGLAAVNISVQLIRIMEVLFPDQMASYIESVEASIGGSDLWLTFLAAAIMAPIVEELALRGMVFRLYEKYNLKPWIIILISAVLFGVFHLNLIQGVFATVVGIIYAIGFYWSKSIWVPILMHFVNNAFSTLATLFPEAWLESLGFEIYSYVMIAVVPLAMWQLYKSIDPKITTS
jgi:membrane protease YdiL (CAAX protease family)